jgi:hypothetical protein
MILSTPEFMYARTAPPWLPEELFLKMHSSRTKSPAWAAAFIAPPVAAVEFPTKEQLAIVGAGVASRRIALLIAPEIEQ